MSVVDFASKLTPMTVNLVYLSPNNKGGWVTFTHHLLHALKAVKINAELFKILRHTETKPRDFGYGRQYRNISVEALINRPGPILVIAVSPSNWAKVRGAHQSFVEVAQQLADARRIGVIVHDPTEQRGLPDVKMDQMVVVRRAGLTHFPGATFIPHPYRPFNPEQRTTSSLWHAVAVSRIDFDKRTHLILDANRRLPDWAKVQIYGYENRIYTKILVTPRAQRSSKLAYGYYPEWEQSKVAYPRDADAAYQLCQRANYMVDLSAIVGDGGGTQYSFLEAMDAGAVVVVHRDWIREDDEMVPDRNCLTVTTGLDLARLLVTPRDLGELRAHGWALLAKHNPAAIGRLYRRFLREVE